MALMPEEVILKMMYLGASKADKLAQLEQLKVASKRIGETARDQLRWALKFTSEDLSHPSLGRWLDAQLELAAFRGNDPRVFAKLPNTVKVPIKSGWFPSVEEVKRIHESFNTVLHSYLTQGEISIRNDKPTDFVLTPAHRLEFQIPDYVAACVVKLMKLIGDFPEHIRRCPTEQYGCGKWFLAEKINTVYCSKTCGGRKRIHELRLRQRKETKKHGTR